MAVVAGSVPAAVTPHEQRPKRPARTRRIRPSSPVRDRLEYGVVRAFVGFLAILPLWVAMRVTEALAFIAWLVDRPHRRIGMRNLEIAFPEKSIGERRRILRASFLNMGRMAAELAHLPRLSDDALRDMVRFENEAWWAEAVTWDRATGVLPLSGHFGNWELLVFAHGRRGHPASMVHRALANPLIDRWFNALRARAGTRLVKKSQAAGEVLRALHDKQFLVLPFDQNSTRGLGVFVPFFGLAASTNSGIARIALRADAPVVPIFIVRDGHRARHTVHVLPIMEVERSGDFQEDVRRNTERFSQVFEDMVRRYPEQWLWVHKRWKTRPQGEPKIY
ncbi:MAG TPA: lysophospholipid acyltransferase family protein [Candidatus Binatia bacterium]|jgi:KDO2-lipid IV(A) lauroyltransferase|nr:lysophospholipid acyltransferase family protein [Candidatus Binatia bacterium]